VNAAERRKETCMNGGRQAAISHNIFPFNATFKPFCLPAAISHNCTVFHAQHLNLLPISRFSNGKFSALKLKFSINQPRHA